MLMQLVIFALAIATAASDNVSPVFLWGVNSPPKSSLQTLEQDDFAELVAPLLENHMIVVFQEKYLSSKDFLCKQADNSGSCYAHLSGFSPKTYYSRVEDPAGALRSLTDDREYNIVKSDGKLEAPLECKPGKVTFVSFDDITTTNVRSDVLEAHDAAIADISKDLSNCRVLYVYTSTYGNVAKSRVRREPVHGGEGFIFHQGNQFMIYWSQLSYNDGSGSGKDYKNITITAMELKNDTEATSFVVSLTGGETPLEFQISHSGGYFTMSKLTYAGQTFYTSELSAPTSFSFHCGDLRVNTLGSDGKKVAYLKWKSLQFQAPFNKKASDKAVFLDSWDCVPFFTPGILSGLFVVILLLAIAFTGICWMIDINTMDRFDDPKGKTITINAND